MSVNLMSSVGSANFTFSVKPTSLNPDPRKKVWIWILQNDVEPTESGFATLVRAQDKINKNNPRKYNG